MLLIHDASGRITSILSSPIPSGGGEILSETDPDISPFTHWVDDDTLTERPAMTASLDGYVLTAPVGASWRLVEPSIGVDETGTVGGDGEVEFEFDDLGTYSLLVTNFPDMDFTAEIEVE
jgi:hypothetical protein